MPKAQEGGSGEIGEDLLNWDGKQTQLWQEEEDEDEEGGEGGSQGGSGGRGGRGGHGGRGGRGAGGGGGFRSRGQKEKDGNRNRKDGASKKFSKTMGSFQPTG